MFILRYCIFGYCKYVVRDIFFLMGFVLGIELDFLEIMFVLVTRN